MAFGSFPLAASGPEQNRADRPRRRDPLDGLSPVHSFCWLRAWHADVVATGRVRSTSPAPAESARIWPDRMDRLSVCPALRTCALLSSTSATSENLVHGLRLPANSG